MYGKHEYFSSLIQSLVSQKDNDPKKNGAGNNWLDAALFHFKFEYYELIYDKQCFHIFFIL